MLDRVSSRKNGFIKKVDNKITLRGGSTNHQHRGGLISYVRLSACLLLILLFVRFLSFFFFSCCNIYNEALNY